MIKKNPFFPEKKAVKATKKAKEALKKELPDSLFKVQAAVAPSKEKAVKIIKDLNAKGFEEIFAHDIGGGKFSIQAGAFKSKENAEKLVKDLKAKGFDGKISDGE
ncbi:MAG: SPOR domain-containing protein [Candidatus Saganbacteria bacterium]|nr:SPOR domain-containing protein [Candidatus Saganbacteria bacterium]